MLSPQQQVMQLLEHLRGKGLHYNLENYTAGLSTLTIRANDPGLSAKAWRLTFQTTLYVQLPTSWEEKDFILASPEKHQQLMDLLNINKQAQEILILLTTDPDSQPEILVLCHKIFLSEEIPVSSAYHMRRE